jgi:hypothetical protein
MAAYVKSDSAWAAYRAGVWEIGSIRGSRLIVAGQQVVGSRTGSIASPSGGSTVDIQARATIDQMLNALQQHGLIET